LRELALALPPDFAPKRVTVTAAGQVVPVTHELNEGRLRIQFATDTVLAAGQVLDAAIA
jgi:hypothetical protein